MAIRDVKQYLMTVQAQVLEMKNDLADFEQAFKDGYITEDKLVEVKDDVAKLDINYQRLLYIDYLLAIPNRKNKKENFMKNKSNIKLQQYFDNNKGSVEAVINEDKSLLDNIRKQLKNITKDKNK